MIRNLIICILICFPFSSFAQVDFGDLGFDPSDFDGAHHSFAIDMTGSMKGCCGADDIWDETIENVCKTINNLRNENCIISINLFDEYLKPLKINGQEILGVELTDNLKDLICEKLNDTIPNGRKTHIFPAFKKMIDNLVDNREILNNYHQNIYLYTDGIDNSDMSCEDAFREWCNLKRDNDYAAIVSLSDSGVPPDFLDCIPEDCIVTTTEPTPIALTFIRPKTNMVFDVQKNEPVQQNWKNQVLNPELRNKRVDIKILKGPFIKGHENVACYFVDENNNRVTRFSALDHELRLFVDKKNLNGGKNGEYEGSFSYDKIIYDENNQKIEIQTPNIKFTYDQNGRWIGTLNLAE